MEASSCSNEEKSIQSPSMPNARPDDLGVLVQPRSEGPTPLHPEVSPAISRPTGTINVANVLRLLEFQHYRCALTGRLLTPDIASLDHIIPVRAGGDHVIENAQILHKDVNKAKTVMTNEQFISLCREVMQHCSS